MKPWRWLRKRVDFTFAQGAAGGALVQSQALALEGEILSIHQVNGINAGTRTAQLTLADQDNFQMFDGTAKASSATVQSAYDFEFGVTIRRILTGNNTLKCTISGDPGAGGFTISAVVYFVGRDG